MNLTLIDKFDCKKYVDEMLVAGLIIFKFAKLNWITN